MPSSNNQYAVYISKVIDLAATIVIKSEDTVQAMNNYLRAFYGSGAVNDGDPTTWRYYLNVSGEYHFADTPMQVVSMDTLEVIDFTKENLAIHRATARAYQYGTRQYQELLTQFPRQRLLIHGILYPIDIDVAIAAADSTILGGYPAGLVEVNEYTFIERLQQWVTMFRTRWFTRAYVVTDNLYLASHLGIMYALLPQAIISLRNDMCKTNEAHSFHVHQYLASHGFLDQYIDQLTTKQALILYKNILYLERNPGQTEVFRWLMDNLLTVRQVPLADYSMRHDLSQQPTEIYPTVFFRRRPLNLGFSYNTEDTATLPQMLTKEAPTARDNAKYQEDVEPVINRQMIHSPANSLQTKALESAMVDYTDSTPYTLEQTLLNHWVWLAFKGFYRSIVNVENPHSGERIALPAKDAYALMMYAFARSLNITLDEIPPFFAMHVQRIPTPSPQDLMSIVDPAYVDIATAKWLLDFQPMIDNIISSDAFYNKCKEIWQAKNTQNNIVSLQEHYKARGYVDNMMNRIYADAMCDLFPGENYTAWFAERNLDISEWSTEDFSTLYTSLVRAATGLALQSSNSISALQTAMLGVMEKLSSYSVQFMKSINASAIVPVQWPMLRLGDIHDEVSDAIQIPILAVRLKNFFAKLKTRLRYEVYGDDFDINLHVHPFDSACMDLKNPVRFGKNPVTYLMASQIAVRATFVEDFPEDTEGMIPVPGITHYLSLTPEQRQHVKTVYDNHWSDRPEGT